MEMTVPARPEEIRNVRRFVSDVTRALHLPVERSDSVVLAVSEACSNAVLHSDSDWLIVVAHIAHERLSLAVCDQGVFRPRIRAIDSEAEQGRGLALARSLVDRLDIQPGTAERPGTTVRISEPLQSWADRVRERVRTVARTNERVERVRAYCLEVRRRAAYRRGPVAPSAD